MDWTTEKLKNRRNTAFHRSLFWIFEGSTAGYALIARTTLIDFGYMIPLFLVPLFVIVVFAVLFSKPFLSLFGDGTTLADKPTTHRSQFSDGGSTLFECLQLPPIGNRIGATVLLLRLEYWTKRNRAIAGLDPAGSLHAVKSCLDLYPFS